MSEGRAVSHLDSYIVEVITESGLHGYGEVSIWILKIDLFAVYLNVT